MSRPRSRANWSGLPAGRGPAVLEGAGVMGMQCSGSRLYGVACPATNAGPSNRAGRGLRAEAAERFRQALQLQPDHVAARAGLGVTLASMRKLPEAVAELRQAVHLRPDFAQVHHNLGVALAELGHLDEAAQCLRQALALQPDYAEAYYNLGNVL